MNDYQFKVVIDIGNQEYFNKMRNALSNEVNFNNTYQLGFTLYLLDRKLNLNGECVKDANSEGIKVRYFLYLLNKELTVDLTKGAEFIISDKEKYKQLSNLITLSNDENPFHELFKRTINSVKPLEGYLKH